MVDERHYSDVFQALPTPCLILLPDAPHFTIINVSDTYLAIANLTRNDIIGRGFFEVFPTNPYQNEAIWHNVFNEVIQNKQPSNFTRQKYAFPTKDTPARLDVKYLDVTNTPVLDEQGEIKFIIRSMTDVTHAVHQETFFEETQDTARIGSWEVNMAHHTVVWSNGMRAIYEVPPTHNPPFKVEEQFYPDPVALKEFENALINATKDDSVFRLTLPAVTAKGNDRWISIVGKSDLVNGTCVRIYGIGQDITESKRLTDLDDLEKMVLEMATQSNIPLTTILSTYILGIEELYKGMYCSILAVRDNHLMNWVAPSLPESYITTVHNLTIGDNVGSCGTAAYRKERVIVSDISNDPKWAGFGNIALEHDLKACWSHPIIDAQNHVIAVLGIYYKQVKVPRTEEILIIDRMSTLLNVIIENRQNADKVRETADTMTQAQELARFGNWQHDIRTKQHIWSSVLCDIYGVNPDIYTPCYDNAMAVVHPDDREQVKNSIQHVIDVGGNAVFEKRIIRPDGEVRHLHSWIRLINSDDGQPEKIIGACIDVTEAKQAELKLKQLHVQLEKHLKKVEQSEQKYSNLFHLSPQPMWVYDLETYRFLDVNAAAIAHYGYSREEFLSMKIMDIAPKQGAAKLKAAADRARHSEELFSKGVFEHCKKNGDVIKVDRLSNVIRFHGRKAELVLLQDITLRLFYIEAIEAQNKKLQEIAWMQSHRVRAPLARIMGLIDLIQNGPATNISQDRLLNEIYTSATELDDILGDITEKAEQITVSHN